MPRRYEEILEDLEAGEISNEEAAQELKRFSTSSLRQEVAKLPEVERERDELRSKVDRLEKAPLRDKAFRDYGVDYASLRPAEIRAIENYDGDLEDEKIGAFVEDLGLPTTQVAAGAPQQQPNAAQVTRAAMQAPAVQRMGPAGQMTPEDAAARAQQDPVWWDTFATEHPFEAEQLEKGITVQMR